MLAVLTLCCIPLQGNADETHFNNFIDVDLTISDISMSEAGMIITYEGIAGKYGLVHATHNMVATNDDTKGHFTNTDQAINDEGVLEKSATLGLWPSSGTRLKVYGFDDDNASRILHISTVDLQEKSFQARVWELE